MNHMRKFFLFIILLCSPAAFGAGTISWLDGVSAVDVNNLSSITIINTGCVQIDDAGGTAIGVLCLDASDDLFVGDATGVDNMVFDVTTSGTFSFDVNGTPKLTIGNDGAVASSGQVSATQFQASNASATLGTAGNTQYFENRLAPSKLQTYIIQVENPSTDAAVFDISIIGQAAGASSTSNLDGSNVNITGGAGASGSAGDADGGDVVIGGGAGAGTGEVGHVEIVDTVKATGSDPALSSCGTSPSIVGSDFAGQVTIGTTVTTSCTVTFDAPMDAAPACVVTGDNTAVGYAATTTTAAMTITSSADMDSDVISFICIGL